MRRRLLSRRNFVGLGVCGLSSLVVRSAGAKQKTFDGPAKQVLVLFEQGGVSHTDTWDPKPLAPEEHRSPFKTIQTRRPGVQLTELLTKTAEHLDKLTIVRCMTQPTPGIGNSHPKGSQYIFSGEAPGGPVEMPDISSVTSYLMGSPAPHLPSNIMVPGTSEQQHNTRIGFLPPAHTVFKTGGRPHLPGWKVPNLGLVGVSEEQFKDRTNLLSNLDVGIPGLAEGCVAAGCNAALLVDGFPVPDAD